MDGVKIALLAYICCCCVSSSQATLCKAIPGKTCTNVHGSMMSSICCVCVLMILLAK